MSYPSLSVKYVLSYPVNTDSKEIKELEIRRPKLRDQLIANKSGESAEDKEVKLLSLLCSVDEEVIHDLDMIDFFKIQEQITNFK